MPNATNVTIRKVFKGKSGEGQYGPWQAYDVYFEGSDHKYSYFGGGKKPEPVVGQKVAFMEFEAVTKGQYTNRTIKKMVIDKTAPAKSQGSPQATNGNKAYIDHGKCVLTLMEMAGGANCDPTVLETLISIFRMGIEAMLKEPEDHSEGDAQDYADGEFGDPPPMGDEMAPF
uniref:Uncharacterized protein n=1 Tax=viral metagenome TaxID=1070528 RepID=A0A6M3XHB8_9ZZZZ